MKSKHIYGITAAVIACICFYVSGNIYGDFTAKAFLGYMGWAFFGQYLIVQFDANARDIESTGSPKKFSTWHLIKDNAIRTGGNLLLAAVAIRFSNDLLHWEMNDWNAVKIGFILEAIPVLFKNVKKKLLPK